MFDFLNTRFFRIYIIPGAVFQSVMIGGGYGTGREIVEYFTSYGFLGGLFGLCIAFAVSGHCSGADLRVFPSFSGIRLPKLF